MRSAFQHETIMASNSNKYGQMRFPDFSVFKTYWILIEAFTKGALAQIPFHILTFWRCLGSGRWTEELAVLLWRILWTCKNMVMLRKLDFLFEVCGTVVISYIGSEIIFYSRCVLSMSWTGQLPYTLRSGVAGYMLLYWLHYGT